MKRVGIKDIAKSLGVNPSTVSRALRGSGGVSEETCRRIRTAAGAMGYRPNFLARGLIGQATRTVGILVPSLNDAFYVEMLASMERWLSEREYSTLLTVTHRFDQGYPHDTRALDSLVDRAVDGVICVGRGGNPAFWKRLNRLSLAGTPVVLHVDAALSREFHGSLIDLTSCDLGLGCREMTRHLLALGHRRIGFALGGGGAKIAGVAEAMREAGVELDPRLVLEMSSTAAREIRERLLSLADRPTAVFVDNDMIAVDLINDLQASGYQIPKDLSIAGIDDTAVSRLLRVPLTTLHLPIAEIGQTLARLLTERMENPAIEQRVVEFDVSVVARESTVPLEDARRASEAHSAEQGQRT